MTIARAGKRWAFPALMLLAGCATVAPPPTDLPEVRPGYIAGYLQPAQLPDTAKLLPPPPAPGSPAQAADEALYKAASKLQGTPRWALAAKDADLTFPNAAAVFSCALGMTISKEATPHLNMLLRRVRMDSSRANDKSRRCHPRARLPVRPEPRDLPGALGQRPRRGARRGSLHRGADAFGPGLRSPDGGGQEGDRRRTRGRSEAAGALRRGGRGARRQVLTALEEETLAPVMLPEMGVSR